MQKNQSPTQEISIYRHCMQQILHDAIANKVNKQDCCHGLLAGGGNMLASRISVTRNRSPNRTPIRPSNSKLIADFCDQQAMLGVYICSHTDQQVDSSALQELAAMVESCSGQPPACYLLLESGHKGRVDALLFADIELTQPIPLILLEDGDLYPTCTSR